MLSPGAWEDRRSLQSRLLALRVFAVVCFGLLLASFWLVQVVQNARYEELADNNYLRTLPLRAPRGLVFDRNDRVLVENRDSFMITLVRERSANLDQTIALLARVTGVDEAAVREIVQRHRREPVFRPITIIEHAALAQVVAVRARQLEMPEVVVQTVPTRRYLDGLGAHLFGYVGEIQDAQLDRGDFAGLEAGAVVGQTGVEKVYNASLMGEDGKRNVVVNSVGREIEELGQLAPIEGKRIQLTVDYDLQRALEDAFRQSGFAGAGVFLSPQTGEVLAMTSLPAYDPNDFAVGIDPATWAELNRDPLTPLENRLIRGRYSPGSTFKIVMAVAGLSEGVITPESTVNCTGGANFYGRYFQCHKKGGHGVVDVRHAIEQSCNVFFYTLGEKLKIDTIHKYGRFLGLVGRTGIDLPGENESLVPSEEWKRRTQNQPWYPGETISVAIGQGAVDVTPISLATMIATVANGGTLVTPHVLRAVDEDGKGWKAAATPSPRSALLIRPDHLQAIRDGLWLAVNGPQGTAQRLRMDGRDVAGKTGTAQVISLQGGRALAGRTSQDLRDHGWLVFFAPRDNPQIAGVVFGEHSEHGYLTAPIVKHVLDTFFAKLEGRPVPVLAPIKAGSTTSDANARDGRGAIGAPRPSAPGGVQGPPPIRR
jgi:penicillin-binding protein 2